MCGAPPRLRILRGGGGGVLTPLDLSALTPAMIVTGSVADSLSPDVFVKADGYKSSWRKTQYLADIFWSWTNPLKEANGLRL